MLSASFSNAIHYVRQFILKLIAQLHHSACHYGSTRAKKMGITSGIFSVQNFGNIFGRFDHVLMFQVALSSKC